MYSECNIDVTSAEEPRAVWKHMAFFCCPKSSAPGRSRKCRRNNRNQREAAKTAAGAAGGGRGGRGGRKRRGEQTGTRPRAGKAACLRRAGAAAPACIPENPRPDGRSRGPAPPSFRQRRKERSTHEFQRNLHLAGRPDNPVGRPLPLHLSGKPHRGKGERRRKKKADEEKP